MSFPVLLILSLSTVSFFFFIASSTTYIYSLSLHDALPILLAGASFHMVFLFKLPSFSIVMTFLSPPDERKTWKLRSEEHTSELQSRGHLVCRLLLEKRKLANNNQQCGQTHIRSNHHNPHRL